VILPPLVFPAECHGAGQKPLKRSFRTSDVGPAGRDVTEESEGDVDAAADVDGALDDLVHVMQRRVRQRLVYLEDLAEILRVLREIRVDPMFVER
jgi:hypothetical protein